MLHVRGVNVFPAAIAENLALFPNRLTGEFQIVLTSPPPYNELPLRVELLPGVPVDEHAFLRERLFESLHRQLEFPRRH